MITTPVRKPSTTASNDDDGDANVDANVEGGTTATPLTPAQEQQLANALSFPKPRQQGTHLIKERERGEWGNRRRR